MKEKFDFESIKNKAIEQLKTGKPLLGKDGTFAPLLTATYGKSGPYHWLIGPQFHNNSP
jgi:hypothetical protein